MNKPKPKPNQKKYKEIERNRFQTFFFLICSSGKMRETEREKMHIFPMGSKKEKIEFNIQRTSEYTHTHID